MAAPAAGELTERVRFERQANAEGDGYGNAKATAWTRLGVRKAKLRPTRSGSGEQVIAGRLQGVASWDLWVRRNAFTRTLTTDDRVVDDNNPSRTFAIRFIGDLDGDRAWLFLQLQEGVAE